MEEKQNYGCEDFGHAPGPSGRCVACGETVKPVMLSCDRMIDWLEEQAHNGGVTITSAHYAVCLKTVDGEWVAATLGGAVKQAIEGAIGRIHLGALVPEVLPIGGCNERSLG